MQIPVTSSPRSMERHGMVLHDLLRHLRAKQRPRGSASRVSLRATASASGRPPLGTEAPRNPPTTRHRFGVRDTGWPPPTAASSATAPPRSSLGAPFAGSMGGQHLNAPIVGMATMPSGDGYYLVASDGGVFNFGVAQFYGSAGGTHLNQPIVGMAVTADGGGYWLVASDGGVFSYGDAQFYGSTGAIHLNKPIVGMASTPNGLGYWHRRLRRRHLQLWQRHLRRLHGRQVAQQAGRRHGRDLPAGGYYLVASDGGIFNFGGAAVPRFDRQASL